MSAVQPQFSPNGSQTRLQESRQSFISPTRLQELRQTTPTHNFGSSSPQPSQHQHSPSAPGAIQNAGTRPQQPPGHGRTTSTGFFSNFRRTTDHNANPAPSVNPAPIPSLRNRTLSNHKQTASMPAAAPPPQPVSPPPANHSAQPPPQPITRATSEEMHPEIRSVVNLTVAHSHKVYFSGPLIRRIERQPDGQRPSKDEGWTEVWAQLGGTTLSVWDMKRINEASQQGKEVPPTYVNMTDAFVQVLGSVTIPPSNNGEQPKRYSNVITLNTAGSNLLLFSCPDPNALISWASALRLAAWEKARLEEIYTAHLVRINLRAPNIPTSLMRGKLEGWVQIRVAGQTDWKKTWMVISEGGLHSERPMSSNGPPTPQGKTMRRMSNLFTRDPSPTPATPSGPPTIAMFASQKPKDKRKPMLTMSNVTQTFAVYPERPELISRSTLIKVEGLLGDEDTAAGMKKREGWLLIMLDIDPAASHSQEMLRWIMAIHDAFGLYGRPEAWTWDPRDPASLMFGYPVGPHRDLLFLDREMVENMDPRDDRTSAVRSRLTGILQDRMNSKGMGRRPSDDGQGNAPRGPPPQLAPLTFDGVNREPDRHMLTPITERSNSIMTTNRPPSIDAQSVLGPRPSLHGVNGQQSPPSPLIEEPPRIPSPPAPSQNGLILTDRTLSTSPITASPASSKPPLPSKDPARYSPQQNLSPVPRTFSPSQDLAQSLAKSHSFMNDTDSYLTSPHSNGEHSVLTSPHSTMNETPPPSIRNVLSGDTPPVPSKHMAPSALRNGQASSDGHGLSNEAGALFYMQNDEPSPPPQPQPQPTYAQLRRPTHSYTSSLQSQDTVSTSPKPGRRSPPTRQGTVGSSSIGSSIQGELLGPRPGLGRKPSGARGPPSSHTSEAPLMMSSRQTTTTTNTDSESQVSDLQMRAEEAYVISPATGRDDDSDDGDALAALSYLDVEDHLPPQPPAPPVTTVEPLKPRSRGPSLSPPPVQREQYKSSFAPSKHAAERKAKAEAEKAAHLAAASRPGRKTNGTRPMRSKPESAKGWNESSEEEDDEEDEDDDASDDERSKTTASSRAGTGPQQTGSGYNSENNAPPSHLRPPRNLPMPPMNQSGSQMSVPRPLGSPSDMDEMGPRRTFLDDGTEIRRPSPLAQQPTGNRQTIWAQALNPGGPAPEPARDTFVQLEGTSNTMTKAFTPQGLLSAGLQDKQERSAKHQEQIARENGASLINVPNKPPPPQTGLLGAITAHERERKREGGMGAALTERERQKRMAEDQQRRFDEQQRQQFEQMQMYGSQYGGYNPMMLNPMMGMNPMMMGMNPMMTGNGQGMNPMMTGNGQNMMTPGGMNPMMSGFPGMMQGYNPQQMFAAQQAAQAYQQAMMAFSTAGSQAGGADSPGGQQGPMNPMMTGGGMSMFDPRMSMMGGPMSMMGGQMGSPMGQMSPMPMQMTGQSSFNPQFGADSNQFGGGQQQFQANGGTPTTENPPQMSNNAQYLSGGGSPGPRGGSPLRGNSRPASPK